MRSAGAGTVRLPAIQGVSPRIAGHYGLFLDAVHHPAELGAKAFEPFGAGLVRYSVPAGRRTHRADRDSLHCAEQDRRPKQRGPLKVLVLFQQVAIVGGHESPHTRRDLTSGYRLDCARG